MQANALTLRFYTLTGPFAFVREESFPSTDAAMQAVRTYAASVGYSSFKMIDDEDGVRITGKTPGGRSGRNIAIGDWTEGDWTE